MKKIAFFIFAALALMATPLMADTQNNGSPDRVDSYWQMATSAPVTTENSGLVFDMDTLKLNFLTAQVQYSTMNFAAATFYDSNKATGTIAVTSNTALSSAAAVNYLNIVTTTNLNASWVKVNGSYFIGTLATGTLASNQWLLVPAYSTQTLANIVSAVNTSSPTTGVYVPGGTVRIATFTAVISGVNGNSLGVSVSTVALGLTSTAGTLFGGRNAAVFKINNAIFRNGVEWATSTDGTSSTTAKNIATAIGLSPALTGMVISTWASNGIVYSTSVNLAATGITMYSSTQGALAVQTVSATNADGSALASFTLMPAGSAATISTGTGRITASTNYTTGLAVLLTATAGTAPGGLTAAVTYYVTAPTAAGFALARTSTDAVKGNQITFTTLTGGGTFVLTPCIYTAGPAGYWFEVSNDSANWVQTSQSTVSIAASAVSSGTWVDFGRVPWRFLRERHQGPTLGAYLYKLFIHGRN